MEKSKISNLLESVFNLLLGILPVVFWLCLIYSFDENVAASLTIIAMVIHELGHVFCIFWFTKSWQIPRGAFNGLRLTEQNMNSYSKQILQYASGALCNLLSAACMLPLRNLLGEYANLFIILNVATAVSNLFPIDGYDGYRILELLIQCFSFGHFAFLVLEIFSFIFIFVMCILSLFLVYTFGNGYWAMGIFLFAAIKKLSKWQDAKQKVKNPTV